MESSFASRDNQDSASADLKIQDGALEAGITNWTPRDQNGAPIHVRRNIGRLAMVCLSFNICNSWTAIASTLAIAISAGGTFTVIYGIIIVSVVYAAMAISLAELASIYPTAGGQYHFTSIIAPKRLSRILSYCCGAAAAYSWVFLSAAVTILAAQVLLAFPEYYVEGYEPQAWQYFLVFQAVNVVIMMYNIFLLKRASWTHEIGCRYTTLLACVSLLILLITVALTLLTFIVVCITCLARSTKQSSTFVWNNFQNNTGWPAGVTFLTGLVTPAAMYLGLDGALHLADECIHPETAVPRALLSTTAIGFCTGLVFSIAMCYSITDLDSLFNTTMPIYELWRQATGSSSAATAFLVALFCVLFFAVNAMQQTASRMTRAFAQDGGLFGAKRLSAIHQRLEVPIWALIANAVVVFVIGCIYLGSMAAFNAVIGCSIILQMTSFAIPIMLLLVQKRNTVVLPANRPFKLPSWLGWSANITVVGFAIVEIVFFTFPPAIPVSGSTMNYASIVLAVTAVLSALNWQFYAKKHYLGPRIVLRG